MMPCYWILFVTLAMGGEFVVSSEKCPPFRKDQHRRVVRFGRMTTNLSLPEDVVSVTWHTPSMACSEETLEFASCAQERFEFPCRTNITGHRAKVVRAATERTPLGTSFAGKINQKRSKGNTSANNNPPTPTPTSSWQPQPSGNGYVIYLEVEWADPRFESYGSSITYRTAAGKEVTMRAFRPHVVYSSASWVKLWCLNTTIEGIKHWYYEVVAPGTAPEMECQLTEIPDVEFHYQYDLMDSLGDYIGSCSCLIPNTGDDWSTRHFRVRAKTRGIRSAETPSYLPALTGDLFSSETTRAPPHRQQQEVETVKIADKMLLVPRPTEEFISYDDDNDDDDDDDDDDDGDDDAGEKEPDPWIDIKVFIEECEWDGNATKNRSEEEKEALKGLITLDQSSCPLYLANGQVASCRCHVTEKSSRYPGLVSRVTWSRQHTEERFITEAPGQATVVAFKYKGIESVYLCVVVDKFNDTLENISYIPRNIEGEASLYSSKMNQELLLIFIAVVINFAIFIGNCIYTLRKKNSHSYRTDICEFASPRREFDSISKRTSGTRKKFSID